MHPLTLPSIHFLSIQRFIPWPLQAPAWCEALCHSGYTKEAQALLWATGKDVYASCADELHTPLWYLLDVSPPLSPLGLCS